jgi:hypothetical protein
VRFAPNTRLGSYEILSLIGAGASPRHLLAIIVHDARKPATTSLEQVHHERQLEACQ